MPKRKGEDPLDELEQQVSIVMERLQVANDADPANAKDWRKSVGMFKDRPSIKEIDQEGERIRREDRERT